MQHASMISPTHLKAHGLTGAEYKLKFPGSILRIQSDISKLKASASKKGKPAWNAGIKTGPNVKLSQSVKGKPKPKLRGLRRTEEQRKNISEGTRSGMIGKMTKEVKAKLSSSIKKRQALGTFIPPMLGKTVSTDTKMKIAATLKMTNDLKSQAILNTFEIAASSQNIKFVSVENNYWIKMHCNNCANDFTFSRQIFRLSTKGGQDICPICHPRAVGRSNLEQELLDFIKSCYNGVIIANDRTILEGKEIDILIPDLKLGFEFTGLYWHAEKQNPENKHLLWKMQYAFKNGITLITIFEDEWLNKKEIVKSRIAGLLGKHLRSIHARDCIVREISVDERNIFLLVNHLQGKDTSSLGLGLYNGEELAALATFKKTNISKGGDGTMWELSRFCSKLNTRVAGGASKLISAFQKFNEDGLDLLSYADRRWSSGKLYETLGFSFAGTSPPSYWYMADYKKRHHRSGFMKHKLIDTPEDKMLTEWELAQLRGYDRIWDCGTTKWILKSNK